MGNFALSEKLTYGHPINPTAVISCASNSVQEVLHRRDDGRSHTLTTGLMLGRGVECSEGVQRGSPQENLWWT